MEKEKLGQEPAFPNPELLHEKGMSKRFYAACAAMQAIISKDVTFTNNIGLPDIKMTISEAYDYADELLKQENE